MGSLTRRESIAHHLVRAVALLSVWLLLSSVLAVTAPAPALAAVGAIDTSDREAVGSAYREVLEPATHVPSGWTGSTQTCTPGSVAEDAEHAALDAINFYRALGGLDPVVLDEALSGKAREAALVMASNNSLSHYVPDDWRCRTDGAAQAAAHSNLALGEYGASAIGLYMTDPGASNTFVGHRRWVMYPSTRAMGSGFTDGSDALWVVGNNAAGDTFKNPEWVSWPSTGYFPSQLEPQGRWSLTANSMWDVDFSGATVRVVGPDRTSLPLTKKTEVDGYGNDTLVWEFADSIPDVVDGSVAAYDVTVSGVTRQGVGQLSPYQYQVKIFDPTSYTASPQPVITGTPAVGRVLIAIAGDWQPTPVALSYQWYQFDPESEYIVGAIPGATQSSYTPTADDVGYRLAVRVTAEKAGYPTGEVYSEPTAVVPATPSITGATPTVSDTSPVVGQTLSVVAGVWGPAPVVLGFQWVRVNSAGVESVISGATGSSYTVQPGDGGFGLRVRVTGSKTGYTTVIKASAVTSPVPKVALSPTPTPTVTGTARVDQTLTAAPGVWGPAPVTLGFQWYRVNSAGTKYAISGATAATYKAQPADVGYKLRVKVTGTKPGYTTTSKWSSSTATVVKATLSLTATPTVTGTARVDQALTAAPGVWGPAPVTLGFQWYRVNSAGTKYAISGATAATYKAQPADVGYTLRVRVKGSKAGYTTVTKWSAATGKVIKAVLTAAPVPTVAGTPAAGQVLTATAGVWAPAPVTLSYQWYRVSATGTRTAITGATTAKYTPTATDRGKIIQVRVKGTKTGYTTGYQYSTPTTIA